MICEQIGCFSESSGSVEVSSTAENGRSKIWPAPAPRPTPRPHNSALNCTLRDIPTVVIGFGDYKEEQPLSVKTPVSKMSVWDFVFMIGVSFLVCNRFTTAI